MALLSAETLVQLSGTLMRVAISTGTCGMFSLWCVDFAAMHVSLDEASLR
eukprot:CAMPEP_0174371406 /NCGR_PEP_ID=MMETSP0811_2-20130205/99631_1 /TAXON_ID=73025 ORGANISM="Eutreptiella gymnastica-like, Strain CCMP1594" /NCGR_SAMPLE_ID=MMETSP0811_2 /ASSEMBLY_ACC=CAM_ASM_000667 /LENGTH=49 /DNA_ID=CAMNT_0015517745 /DNA_START=154 /DNA_END=303 /DNA_ORIENTATION=-